VVVGVEVVEVAANLEVELDWLTAPGPSHAVSTSATQANQRMWLLIEPISGNEPDQQYVAVISHLQGSSTGSRTVLLSGRWLRRLQ
jgi:hypothetical protein